jgi:hypothetical protein
MIIETAIVLMGAVGMKIAIQNEEKILSTFEKTWIDQTTSQINTSSFVVNYDDVVLHVADMSLAESN